MKRSHREAFALWRREIVTCLDSGSDFSERLRLIYWTMQVFRSGAVEFETLEMIDFIHIYHCVHNASEEATNSDAPTRKARGSTSCRRLNEGPLKPYSLRPNIRTGRIDGHRTMNTSRPALANP